MGPGNRPLDLEWLEDFLALAETGNFSRAAEARAIAQTHLTAVRAKMAELRRLDRSLSRYVRACSEGCAGGPAPNCNILTDLRQSVPGGTDSSGCCS